jgi:hypothetical protein
MGGLKPPGGDAGKMVGEGLVGGEDLVKKATEMKDAGLGASEAVARLLEEYGQLLNDIDSMLRQRIPQPKPTGSGPYGYSTNIDTNQSTGLKCSG